MNEIEFFQTEKWRAAALCNKGKKRPRNEDSFAFLPEKNIFIVADGMGKKNAGGHAAQMVTQYLPEELESALSIQDEEKCIVELKTATLSLSQRMWDRTQKIEQLNGMGATLVLAYFREQKAFIANMGDSRAYLYRNGMLHQLTRDHSIASILLQQGKITKEEARVHPSKNKLSRYMGMKEEVFADVNTKDMFANDILLLCSDGLSSMATDEEIAKCIAKSHSAQHLCQDLVDLANENGGEDNITVVVVRW